MSLQIPPREYFPPIKTYERENEVTSFCNDYMLKHFPFHNDAEREKFIRMGIPAYICKIIPFATDHEKMCKAAILNTYYFFFDDCVDKDGMGLEKKAPGGSGKKSLFDISDELNESIRMDMPPADYDRIVRMTKEYLRVQSTPDYSSIEELIKIRAIQVGAYVLYSTIRYAMELSVTEDELMDPIVEKCQTLCAEACLLRNDVSSYIKEVNDGSAQNNIITKIQEWSNCGADEAKRWALSAITEREAKLHAACNEALDSQHLSVDAKKFIHSLPYLHGGNTWWHHHSSRYSEGRRGFVET